MANMDIFQNLLRSLRSGAFADGADGELKALLSDVREARAHDAKVIDQFYDSLEGLLSELKMVTMDNRDAEAFLKPVSRQEVPDYFDVIAHPMDLQTMLKKVKGKQYKSKLEFSDDLNLIWDNCFRYNSTPDHPLRACAMRLRDKANTLLARITDRSDRQAPRVAQLVNGALPSPPSSNEDHGEHRPLLNGKSRSSLNGKAIIKTKVKDKDRTPLPIKIPPLQRPGSRPPAYIKSQTQSGSQTPKAATPQAMLFEDRSAIIRTQDSMAQFMELDRRLDEFLEAQSTQASSSQHVNAVASTSQLPSIASDTLVRTSSGSHILTKRMRALVEAEVERESEQAPTNIWTSRSSITGLDLIPSPVKRKRSPSVTLEDANGGHKKIKVEPDEDDLPAEPITSADPLVSVLDLWWKSVGTNTMISSALPSITQPVPYPPMPTPPRREKGKGTAKRKRTNRSMRMDVDSPAKASTKAKRKRVKNEKSLLHLMNNNIATLRKLRSTHFKYSQLTRDVDGKDGGTGEGGETQGQLPSDPSTLLVQDAPTVEMSEQNLKKSERAWKVRGEVGEQEAVECYTWMTEKVLQHATFQGTSTMAMQYMTDLTIQYISNVGKTMRIMMDKYSQKMSAEELILHSLFENGMPHVSELERYIKEDVLRHGARLVDAEKKISGALQEIINADAIDDDAMFGENADDDNFSSGLFGDLLGEDYLGLEAAGILSEIGLPNLSIPRRLWKGKKPGDGGADGSGSKAEAKLPFPPPPPFIPLRSDKVDEQIGLIQGYFRDRFAALMVPPGELAYAQPPSEGGAPGDIPKIAVQPPTTPTLPTTFIPPHSAMPQPGSGALVPPGLYTLSQLSPSEPIILLDDAPDPIRSKLGPLGQIIHPSANALAMKKKKDKKDGILGAGLGVPGIGGAGVGGAGAAGGDKPTADKPKPTGGSKKAAPKDKSAKDSAAPAPSKKKKSGGNAGGSNSAAGSAGGSGTGTPSPSKRAGGSKAKAAAPKAAVLVPPV